MKWCNDGERSFKAIAGSGQGSPVLIGYREVAGARDIGLYVIAQFGDQYGLRMFADIKNKHTMFPTIEAAQVTAEILHKEPT